MRRRAIDIVPYSLRGTGRGSRSCSALRRKDLNGGDLECCRLARLKAHGHHLEGPVDVDVYNRLDRTAVFVCVPVWYGRQSGMNVQQDRSGGPRRHDRHCAGLDRLSGRGLARMA